MANNDKKGVPEKGRNAAFILVLSGVDLNLFLVVINGVNEFDISAKSAEFLNDILVTALDIDG